MVLGDAVIVMIDFNHPYLTPFINKIWPMVHLVSAQQGIIEKFRISRALSSPPAIYMGSATAVIDLYALPQPRQKPIPPRQLQQLPLRQHRPTRKLPVPRRHRIAVFSHLPSSVFTLTTYGATQPRANITILKFQRPGYLYPEPGF